MPGYNSAQNLFLSLLIYDHTYREHFHHNLCYCDINYFFLEIDRKVKKMDYFIEYS